MRLVGDIVKQVRGVTYKKEQAISQPINGYKPVLRAGNIASSRILEEDFVYVPEDLIKNERLLKYGDILIAASSGSLSVVGKAAMLEMDMDAGFGAFCKVLRPKTEIVFPRYFKYFFETAYYKTTIRHLAEGANINNLKSEHFHNLEIPLPPLAEQQKIAAILDAADSLRQKDRQLIDHYTTLSQSLFLEMFGDPITNPMRWEKVEFGSIGKLDRGKSKHRPRNAPELLGGAHPLIQTGDVANCGGYIRQFHSTYSDIGLKQSKMWKAGTLCITIAANIAKTGILEFDACFPDSVVGFIPNEQSNKEYVRYWLSFLQKTLEDSAPMAAQKNINLKILRELNIPLPPVSLQKQFAERIKLIEAQKQQAQASLIKTEALFNSLLQHAFTGDLTENLAA